MFGKKFADVYQQGISTAGLFGTKNINIVQDKETGVEYVVFTYEGTNGGGASITPRLDSNGKPYIER